MTHGSWVLGYFPSGNVFVWQRAASYCGGWESAAVDLDAFSRFDKSMQESLGEKGGFSSRMDAEH